MFNDAESTSFNIPSESEVIITNNSGNPDRNGLKHKVIVPTAETARRFLKKPQCPKRVSITMVQVIVLGLMLLLLILCCILIETWWSSNRDKLAKNLDENLPSHINPKPLTARDEEYHKRMINDVNSQPNVTWKAVFNKFASRYETVFGGHDVFRPSYTQLAFSINRWTQEQLFAETEVHLKELTTTKIQLPETFDTRIKWPLCSSVHKVQNQGGCGSCWAMVTASVISDRMCIHSNGSLQSQTSAQDLISCCPECGGCTGTDWALLAFVHWKEVGLVTGGGFGSFDGCKPYKHAPNCGSPCSLESYGKERHHAIKCDRSCQSLYDVTYENDLHKAKRAYWIKPNGMTRGLYPVTDKRINATVSKSSYEELIKKEIFLNGPVLACFMAYEEFQHYKSGIYSSRTSKYTKPLYGHCAKLIGWGSEHGTPYWQYMNTWGSSWGENGFFRVRLSELPEEVAAGLPML
uniref:Peptidase C1A papain C-terminal domain-containing protein n=1 Tax=Acrobeloides nanus TaxID=290746 RepID=A0A914CSL9_9BILA